MNESRSFRIPFNPLDGLQVAAGLLGLALLAGSVCGLPLLAPPGLLVLALLFSFVGCNPGSLEYHESGYVLRKRWPEGPRPRRREARYQDLDLRPDRWAVSRRGGVFRFSSLERDFTVRMGAETEPLEQALRAMGYAFQD